MTDDGLDDALSDVSKKIQTSVDTIQELKKELHEEKKWRRWTMFFMAVAVVCILLLGSFSVLVLVSVRDCTQPNGSCYKTAVQREDDRRRTSLASSNKIIGDILNRISNDLNSQLKTLENNLTTIINK